MLLDFIELTFNLSRWRHGPLLNTLKVKYMKTTVTTPYGFLTSNILAANHAFTLILTNLFSENFASSQILSRCKFIRVLFFWVGFFWLLWPS